MVTKKSRPQRATLTRGAHLGYEAKLWHMADALPGSLDATKYKHVVLGLIFLKNISQAFGEHRQRPAQKPYADPDDLNEYRPANVFWMLPEAWWECSGQFLDYISTIPMRNADPAWVQHIISQYSQPLIL